MKEATSTPFCRNFWPLRPLAGAKGARGRRRKEKPGGGALKRIAELIFSFKRAAGSASTKSGPFFRAEITNLSLNNFKAGPTLALKRLDTPPHPAKEFSRRRQGDHTSNSPISTGIEQIRSSTPSRATKPSRKFHGVPTTTLLFLVFFTCLPCAAQVLTLNLSTLTISAIMPQPITVAEHSSLVGSFNASTFDQWAVFGSSTLQMTSNVPCPVQLFRMGDMGVFYDTAPYNFDVIDSTGAFYALEQYNPNYLAKVVTTISTCGPLTEAPGIIQGCTIPGNLVIITNPDVQIILTHEFGHNKNLDDVTGDPNRIMYYAPSGSSVNVTPAECQAYEH